MSVWLAVFLGIVQGITEFLPVSSSGHLSILQNLIGVKYSESDHLLFDVLLHLGTLISICVVYRDDIRQMIKGAAKFVRGEQDFSVFGDPLIPPAKMVIFIIIATLPLFVALPFYSSISSLYFKTGFIGFALIITGCLLFAADRLVSQGNRTEKNMTVKDALIIGFAQAFALIPGLSRSGTTITVAMTRGFDRNFAVRFSLLLSIPAVLGSLILSLVHALSAGVNWQLAPVYLLGFVVSALVGYGSVKLLRTIVRKNRFGKFSYYCWAVGILTILLSIIL